MAIYSEAIILIASVFSLLIKIKSTLADKKFPDLYTTDVSAFVQPNSKTVYLTFDDGPSRKVLDVLKEQGMKATFFVTTQKTDQPYASELLAHCG